MFFTRLYQRVSAAEKTIRFLNAYVDEIYHLVDRVNDQFEDFRLRQIELNRVIADDMKNCRMSLVEAPVVPMVNADQNESAPSEKAVSTGTIAIKGKEKPKSLSRRILEFLRDQPSNECPTWAVKRALMGSREVLLGGGHFSRSLGRLEDRNLIFVDLSSFEMAHSSISLSGRGKAALDLDWDTLNEYDSLPFCG